MVHLVALGLGSRYHTKPVGDYYQRRSAGSVPASKLGQMTSAASSSPIVAPAVKSVAYSVASIPRMLLAWRSLEASEAAVYGR